MISLQQITDTTTGYIFKGNNILCCTDSKKYRDPLLLSQFSSILKDKFCCVETNSSLTEATVTGVQATKDATAPNGYSFLPVRDVVFENRNSEQCAQNILRAKALTHWISQNQYCSSCGNKMKPLLHETALICPQCSTVVYPRISPAVIVLVHKEDKILLARHAQRNQDMYTCLAGFVESGESLEQAVIREVKEETAITVTNIRYAGSQSWPYPDQLMIAFHADYLSGSITVQKDEIQEAQWFDTTNLPATPPCGSVAWNLIYSSLKKNSPC